jgi:hypothetical protein
MINKKNSFKVLLFFTICIWIAILIAFHMFFMIGIDYFKDVNSLQNVKYLLFIVFIINFLGILNITFIVILLYNKHIEDIRTMSADIKDIKEKIKK